MKPNRTNIIADPAIMETFRRAADGLGVAGNKGNRFGRALQAALLMWADAPERMKLHWLDQVDRTLNRAAVKARRRSGSAADAAHDESQAATQSDPRAQPGSRRTGGRNAS